MGHASKQRMTAEGDNNKIDSIAITQFWEEELRNMPYLSRKYHRFLICLRLAHHLAVEQHGL